MPQKPKRLVDKSGRKVELTKEVVAFIDHLKDPARGYDRTWKEFSQLYFKGKKSTDTIRHLAYRHGITVEKKVWVAPKTRVIKDKTVNEDTPQIKALLDYVLKNGKTHTFPELSQMFNPDANPEWSANVLKSRNIVVEDRQKDPQKRIEDRVLANQIFKVNAEKKTLLDQLSDKQRELEFLFRMKEFTPDSFDIPMPSSNKNNEGTAVALWSDWHVGERIKISVTAGKNLYNTGVAKERASLLFQNQVKLINMFRAGTTIRKLVIGGIGDFMTGYIHPELEQENELSPPEEIEFASELLFTGIDYQLKYGEFDEITLILIPGNHARITKKMQGNNYRMNYERTIFYILRKMFSDNKKVKIRAEDSELVHQQIYGKTYRFLHGHQVQYQGGIGGFNVPLNRMLKDWNDIEWADYTFIGHHHTLCEPNPRVRINGSLIGYGARALGKGYQFQKPMQSLTLIDSKRGVNVHAPIYCY